MAKVELNLTQMKQLMDLAATNGTLKAWAPIAVEWMEGAQKYITKLETELAAAKEQKS